MTRPRPVFLLPATLVLALAAGAAAAGGWGDAGYRTTLLSDGNPRGVSGRYLPLDGWTSAPEGGASGGLREAAAQRPELSLVAAALARADARDLLPEETPHTLFAPVDAALAGLAHGGHGERELGAVASARLLAAHLVSGRVTARELAARDQIATLDGRTRALDPRGGMHLGEARVILADIPAGIHLIHLLDRPLVFQGPAVTSAFSMNRFASAHFSRTSDRSD